MFIRKKLLLKTFSVLWTRLRLLNGSCDRYIRWCGWLHWQSDPYKVEDVVLLQHHLQKTCLLYIYIYFIVVFIFVVAFEQEELNNLPLVCDCRYFLPLRQKNIWEKKMAKSDEASRSLYNHIHVAILVSKTK